MVGLRNILVDGIKKTLGFSIGCVPQIQRALKRGRRDGGVAGTVEPCSGKQALFFDGLDVQHND